MANELMEGFVAAFGEEDLENLSISLAKEQIAEEHAWMLKILSVESFIEQTPAIHGFYYQGGRLLVDSLEPGAASLSLWSCGIFQGWHRRCVTNWLHRALEMLEASDVSVTHLPPLEGCRYRYELRWRA